VGIGPDHVREHVRVLGIPLAARYLAVLAGPSGNSGPVLAGLPRAAAVQAGWHARRHDARYLQTRREGGPAFAVHAGSPAGVAAQLRWQQAADRHAPDGYAAGQLPGARWAGAG
jgi:hypothetical protein